MSKPRAAALAAALAAVAIVAVMADAPSFCVQERADAVAALVDGDAGPLHVCQVLQGYQQCVGLAVAGLPHNRLDEISGALADVKALFDQSAADCGQQLKPQSTISEFNGTLRLNTEKDVQFVRRSVESVSVFDVLSKCQDLQSDFQQLKAQFDLVKQAAQDQVRISQQVFANLTSDLVSSATSDVTALSQEVGALKAMLSGSNSSLGQVEAAISKIESRLAGAEESLDGLSDAVADHTTQLEGLGDADQALADCFAKGNVIVNNACTALYKECDPAAITPPSNGVVSGHGKLPGTAYHFSCNDGFYLAGDDKTFCTETGAWSQYNVQCKACSQGCKTCITANVCTECTDAQLVNGNCQAAPTEQNPAKDCNLLHQQLPNLPSGSYWIKPGSTSFLAYCDMVTDGGGWTLVSKTNGNDGRDSHVNNNDVNLACLQHPATTCSGTIGDAKRHALGKMQRFTCGGSTMYGYIIQHVTVSQQWGTSEYLRWADSFGGDTASAYTTNSATDCGATDCDGPAYAGRNWGRNGYGGCGLFVGYGNVGTWYAK